MAAEVYFRLPQFHSSNLRFQRRHSDFELCDDDVKYERFRKLPHLCLIHLKFNFDLTDDAFATPQAEAVAV